jgi:hypothetical protein
MGTVHLVISTSSPEAQAFFDQGLAQMHSFWAREAERSFLQPAALDPKAPMPQWGIAMVAAGGLGSLAAQRRRVRRLFRLHGAGPKDDGDSGEEECRCPYGRADPVSRQARFSLQRPDEFRWRRPAFGKRDVGVHLRLQ